ncbi:MAG: chromosome segregation protein SMC [Rhodospirillales bacterium]
MLQLSRLKLSGFKSFAEPTEVSIEAGLTGIVGPNGCGKSNLIEALRWVMGESSARTLRGGDMDDVIFAGAGTRASRNVAEVTIDLDTSQGGAPPAWAGLDLLQVTRRIDRGRGSTYRVNGREVRARDVQLLFADAATGARSAAMVTQGQVAALIAAKPLERRALLEEAAGISGLHGRRQEAEQRLKAAEDNLLRVEDVLATLAVQAQSLARQSKQAARYRQVSEQIRTTETCVLGRRWRQAANASERAAARLAAADVAITTAGTAAGAAEAARQEAVAAMPSLREAKANADAARQRLISMSEGLAAEAARLEADRDACRQRLSETAADVARQETLHRDAAATVARQVDERERLIAAGRNDDERRRRAEADVAHGETRLSALEEELARLTERVAMKDAARAAATRRIEELRREVERLTGRLRTVVADEVALATASGRQPEADAALARVGPAEATLTAARADLAAAEEEAGRAAGHMAETGALDQAAATEAAGLAAEVRALAELVEGDGQSGRPLIDAFTVDAGLEAALAAALAEDAFLPLAGDAPADWRMLPAHADEPVLPAEAAPLSASLTGPPALDRRLAQIGVVADRQRGDDLQSRLAPGQRLVSRAGDLWRWDGLMRPAGEASAAAVRLDQRQRLAASRTALARAEARATAAAGAQRSARERVRAAGEAVGRARAAVREGERALDAVRRAAAQEQDARVRHEARAQALAASRAGIEADLADAEARRAAAMDAAAETVADNGDEAAREACRAAVAESRRDSLDRRRALDTVLRESGGRRRRLQILGEELAAWESRRDEAWQAIAELSERRAAAESRFAELETRPAELARRRQLLAEEIAQAEHRTGEAAGRLTDGERRLDHADAELRAREADLAKTREERVRAEAAVEQATTAQTQLRHLIDERLSVAPEGLAVLAAEVADGSEIDVGREERRLDALKRERDLIGPVNLRAEDERTELETERARLDGQRQDLLQAATKLRQGVAELDREGRERLLAAFTEVDRQFRALFGRLFGGGHAHLALTDADDPLATGLEVMASPPGKKLQSLSLLSGGEQALTALALRFAVFLCKQAPICVLDEVDAPLDDANVDRLCSMLEDLGRERTRFLVITHHRLTMARMHRLYGVTMAERGVSQLVSVEMQRPDGLRSAG